MNEEDMTPEEIELMKIEPPAYDYTSLVGTYIREEQSKWHQAVEKPDLLGWFVGKIMKDTDGKADPGMVLAELFRQAEIARSS